LQHCPTTKASSSCVPVGFPFVRAAFTSSRRVGRRRRRRRDCRGLFRRQLHSEEEIVAQQLRCTDGDEAVVERSIGIEARGGGGSSSTSSIFTRTTTEVAASRLGLDPALNRRHPPFVYHEDYSFDGWPATFTFPVSHFDIAAIGYFCVLHVALSQTQS